MCANHYILPGINFKRHPQKSVACMWNARDFAVMDIEKSDSNGTNELFMAHFKTDEITNEFEKLVKCCLEKASLVSPENTALTEHEAEEEKDKLKPTPFSSSLEKLLPKPGSWTCNTCALVVNPSAEKCPACQTVKPDTKAEQKSNTPGLASIRGGLEKLLPKPGSWTCNTCALVVNPSAEKCPACQTVKPGSKITQNAPIISSQPSSTFNFLSSTPTSTSGITTSFVFGGASNNQTTTSTPVSKFIFGNSPAIATKSSEQPPTASSNASTVETKAAGTSSGVFTDVDLIKGLDKLGSVFTFKMKPPTPNKGKIHEESTCHEDDTEEGQEEEDTEVSANDLSQATFKPIVDHLPDKIEVLTGEEDEEIVFEARAKLHRFDNSGVWKERGLGQLKLLRSPDSGQVRIVMRREQVHKVCCNHPITSGMSLKPLAGSRAPIVPWVWWAVDFSDVDVGHEGRKEMFSVRFKTAEESEAFHDAFMAAVTAAGSPVDLIADEDELVIVENPVGDILFILYCSSLNGLRF